MSKHTVLVCGATGTIGGATLTELLKRGASVRALVRDPKKAAGLEAGGAQLVSGDLGSTESVRAALKGVDEVFFLVPGNPYQPDQVELATRFLKAVEGSDVKHLVYNSMWGASRSVNKPMVMQNHARIEDAIISLGRPYTFLQTTFTMQALTYGQGVGRSVAAEGRMFTPFGTAGFALIDARDVGRAAAACLTSAGHAGKTYELSGPASLTSSELAATLTKVLERPVADVPLTVEQAIGGMKQLGLPDWFTSHMAVLAAYNRTGALARVTSSVADLTGAPATPFEQFVRDHRAAFQPA
jgi:uncharacterized protein YbjT (DUF2867 family)